MEKNLKSIIIRVPENEVTVIKEKAAAESRSVNNWILNVIRKILKGEVKA